MEVKKSIHRFGNFTLRAGEHSLQMDQKEIHLRPKVFETLLFLVERNGHLVKKQELLSSIWQDVVVTENTLNKCIEQLRHVMQDSPQNPKFIQTIPRVGFKFIADVEVISGSDRKIEPVERQSPLKAILEDQAEQTGSVTGKSTQKEVLNYFALKSSILWRRIFILVVVVILGFLISFGLDFMNRGSETFNSIAVLPFTNLSGDPDQEYFADGMTEALIAELAKNRIARVISRTSVMGYKEILKPLPEIAKELNVDLVVEGSVQRNGNRILVIVQLINPQTDKHIWVKSYEENIQDILLLQQELAQSIALEIKLELIPSQKNVIAEQVDPETYEAYLKGRFYWNKRTPDGFRKGIEYFKQAIELEPNYALAYVGLADCYNMLSNYDALPPKEVFPKVSEALTQAFRINSELPEAYASLAFVKMFYEWNWPEAEKALQRSIELNPNLADAHHWYGLNLAMQQRFDEALAEMRKALSLDPLSIIINTNIGWVLYFARRYNEAVKQIQQSLEFDSTFISGHIKLGWALEQLSEHEKAIREFQTGLRLIGDDPALKAILANAYALANRKNESLKIVRQLIERTQQEYVTSYMISVVYTSLGDKEKAFSWLQKAYQKKDGWIAWLKVDPKLDPLRTDPRFTELIDKVGFK